MQASRNAAVAAIFGLAAAAATATPSIEKLILTPAGSARVGEKVVATVEFANPGEGLCAIELEFGDGRREAFKIKPDTKLPIVVEHTYQEAREYKVRAAGDKLENAFGCLGKEIVMYKVEAAAPPAPPPKVPVAGECPADWSLKGKVAGNGSFTCIPAKGVKNPARPAKALDCPAGTSYFIKGKTLGCEAG